VSICSCGRYAYSVTGEFGGWGWPWLKGIFKFPDEFRGVRHSMCPPQDCESCRDTLLQDGGIDRSDKSVEDSQRAVNEWTANEAIANKYGKELSSYTGPPPQRVKDGGVGQLRAIAKALRRAQRVFQKIIERLRKEGSTIISGDDAFTLQATYGIDICTIEDIAATQGMTVDNAGFEEAMEEHRERSRPKKVGLQVWT